MSNYWFNRKELLKKAHKKAKKCKGKKILPKTQRSYKEEGKTQVSNDVRRR